MKKKSKKIIRLKQPIHINIGVIIFLFVFIYLAYSVITYLTTERVHLYEVGEEAALIQNPVYTGLILRDENIVTTDRAGYVNFYIRESSRAAVDDVVYSLDENGQFTEMLNNNTTTESRLSTDNLSELKKSLAGFVSGYDGMNFHQVYDLKYSIENKLLSFITTNSLDDLENLGIDTDYFHTRRAMQSGIVEYYIDGYEKMEPAQVTMDDFNRGGYTKTSIRGGDLVESGGAVYKTLSSEIWTILIPLGDGEAAEYADVNHVDVTFTEKGLSTTVNFALLSGADGKYYGQLSLSKYMVQYANQRYLEVMIHQDQTKGLQIPKTAVITKELCPIPKEYLTTGGNTGSHGFQKVIATTDGSSVEFITPTIYYSTDTSYYVAPEDVPAGTILAKPDSADRFTVAAIETVSGVYNVNKGYAIFKAIEVLDENEEYYIVRKGMDYGLAIYDHILLDGSLANEGEMVY